MRTRAKRTEAVNDRGIVLIVALAFVLAICRPGAAGPIEYAWSGLLVPPGATRSQIAELGKPFDLHVVVENDAADYFALELVFAGYFVSSVELRVEDQLVPYVGNGFIDFTDDWSAMLDLVVFNGEFEISGETTEIGSLAALPTSTFQFGQLAEPPPVFGPAVNADVSSCCGGGYTTVVPAGNLVTAVPEPGTIGMLFGFGAAASAQQRGRRRKIRNRRQKNRG
jgi:hypothetical protein